MNNDDNATFNNVSAEKKIITYHRRSHLKPLATYIRKRRKASLKTCRRQRIKVSCNSVMNSLSNQDDVQNGDRSIELPSVCSSKSMCQIEVTAGDGAPLTVLEDITLEKAIDGCHDCEHAAAKSVKVNGDKVSSDSVMDIKKENVVMAQSALQDNVEDKVCDVLVAEENLTKSTCSQENNATRDAEVVQRQENTMGNSTPSSSQTTVVTQFKNEDMKLSLTRPLPGGSRRKLLVLDVNGLLADIVPMAYVSDRYKPDTTISGKAVFKRPFSDEFLEFCFRRFSVGVWSSRTKRNVDSVVDFLMGKVRKNLLFCWDQSHCTATGYSTVENSSKPLVLKELKKLWEKSEQDLPWEIGEYNESNTLLLDDSPYKALLNPSNTAIFPHSYQYRDNRDNSLGPGGCLYVYLEGLAEAADVQTYVKQNPFGQKPITKENSSWDFYLKVIESSASIPSQSLKDSVKSESVVSQAKLTSFGVGKLEEFVDNKCNNQEFPTTVSSHEVPEITNAPRNVEGDSARGSLKQEELKRVSGMLEVDEVGRLVRENTTVCDSGGSPSWIRRGRKRSRSRSPIRGISPSRSRYPRDWRSPWGERESHGRSHSLSYERCRSRSRSPSHRPSYRRGGEFGGDSIRKYKAPLQECRDFMRGKCYRGASCWYLHHESDMTDRSGSHSCRQQYQNVPPSSNSSYINGNIETSPPERSGHEHGVRKTLDLDHDILVMEERKGRKEDLCKFTNQVPHKMRRYEAFREECRDFVRGKCHRGASCRYLHHEYDRSRSYMSKQQYQDVPPSSKRCDVYCGTRMIPFGRSVHEPQDLRQEISIMWKAGMKEDLGKFTPQLCDKMQMYEPSVPECHHFMRGRCSYGAKCWYPHNESDRSRAYRSREQYQNVPFSLKSCDINGENESSHREISVDEDKEDLKQNVPVMEEKEGKKEEVGESTTQVSDRGSSPHADAEEERVPNDVAQCLPADPVEISQLSIEQTRVV